MTLESKKPRRWRLALALTAALGVTAIAATAIAAGPKLYRLSHQPRHISAEDAQERADYLAEKIIDKLDGTPAQEAQMKKILSGRVPAALALRTESITLRDRAFSALMKAPRPDKAEVEALRVEGVALADKASKLLMDTLFEAQAVLTDEQLVELRDKLSFLYD